MRFPLGTDSNTTGDCPSLRRLSNPQPAATTSARVAGPLSPLAVRIGGYPS